MEIEGERQVPLWRPRRRRGAEIGERGDEISRVRGAVAGGAVRRRADGGSGRSPDGVGRGGAARRGERRICDAGGTGGEGV
jgi:hypothetical protein